MHRALELLEQPADVVIGAPGSRSAEIVRFEAEAPTAPRGAVLGESGAQVFVDHRPERPATASRFRLQARGDVVVERESGSHILML